MENNNDFYLPLSWDTTNEELSNRNRFINNYSTPIIVKEETPIFIPEVKSEPFTKKQWKKLTQEMKKIFLSLKKLL
jgi:hypothetical protein